MSDAPRKSEAAEDVGLDVKAGDFVRVTAEAMADPELKDVTPIRLFKLAGWPNKFMVVDVAIDADEGQVLRLDPCCGWLLEPKGREEHACQAHPAKYFERHPEEETEKPSGNRSMGINIAGFDLVSVEYVDGKGKDPSLVVKLVGQKPIVLEGKAAQQFAQLLKSKKLL